MYAHHHQRINLVPLRGLVRTTDISRVQAVPNIALGVPFGFGAFFVVRRATPLRILGLGALFFLGIEIAQVILTQVAPAAPRTGDINDLMLNTFGVAMK